MRLGLIELTNKKARSIICSRALFYVTRKIINDNFVGASTSIDAIV
jgi:hypothetical protein